MKLPSTQYTMGTALKYAENLSARVEVFLSGGNVVTGYVHESDGIGVILVDRVGTCSFVKMEAIVGVTFDLPQDERPAIPMGGGDGDVDAA